MATMKAACRDNPHVRDGQIDTLYRVLEFVGGGGTACVYKVRTQDDPHPYALKLLQEKYFRNEFVLKQFALEGERLLQLQHPNIVRFYAIAIRDDFAYLLMDYVTGYELSELLRAFREQNRLMPVNEVIRTLVQAARAINFLHSRDLIHRDIKAANILLEDTTGKVFLVDFGIVTEASQAATTFNAGTRAYMPPEQQENIGLPVTQYSDLYAFAIMAYEMLAGRRPFINDQGLKGADAELDLIQKHRYAPVPPLSTFRPDLPSGLDPIFQKALAKQPEERYGSASEFVADLHQVLLPILSPELHHLDEVAPRDPRKILQEQIARLERVSELPLRPLIPADTPKAANRAWMVALVVGLLILAGFALILLSQNGPQPEATRASVTLPPPTEVTQMTEEISITASPEAQESPTITSSPTVTASITPSATPSVTSSPTPSATATPSTTPTPPPTDIPEQPHYPLAIWEGAALLGLEGQSLEQALAKRLDSEAPRIRLNIGPDLQNYRLEVGFASLDGIAEYGAILRWADDERYLRFVLNPGTQVWRLESIQAGQTQLLQSGPLEGDATELLLQSYEQTLRISLGSQLIQAVIPGPLEGGLGLWIESQGAGVPALTVLNVSLIGEELNAALTATPTPALRYNPLTALQSDVEALLGTGDAIALSINCAAFMPIFEGLESYLSSSDERLVSLTQSALQSNEIIYSLCDSSLDSQSTITIQAIRDYQAWEQALRDLTSTIGLALNS